jgi:hypothetical protein
VDREYPSFGRCEEGKDLLYDERDERSTKYYPKSDGSSLIPLPSASGEGENNLEEREDCGVEYRANPVDSSEFSRSRDLGLCIVLREQEDVYWREQGSERKVDVKCKAPGCRRD